MALILRVFVGLLLFLNFCMYTIVLCIGFWAMNKIEGPGPGFDLAAHFFVVYALIGGVVGVASAIPGLDHIYCWDNHTLSTTYSAATIAWSLTALTMGTGFAREETQLHIRNARLRNMEVLIIILFATQLVYILAIQGSSSRRRNRVI